MKDFLARIQCLKVVLVVKKYARHLETESNSNSTSHLAPSLSYITSDRISSHSSYPKIDHRRRAIDKILFEKPIEDSGQRLLNQYIKETTIILLPDEVVIGSTSQSDEEAVR